MITLYSTGCAKCAVLNLKLKQLHLDYDIVTDSDKTVEIAKANGIDSAPILQVEDKFYNFKDALEYLKGVK